MSSTCKIPDCERPVSKRGYCDPHYLRWKRHGDPLHGGPIRPFDREERFWARVNKTETCWLWTGPVNNQGYGMFANKLAHRTAYQYAIGPIPEGKELDHAKKQGCTSKLCVKVITDEHGPAHLEPVTHQENMRRGFWGAKTHCPRGHPYDTKRPNGSRRCSICDKANARRRYVSKRSHLRPQSRLAPARPAAP